MKNGKCGVWLNFDVAFGDFLMCQFVLRVYYLNISCIFVGLQAWIDNGREEETDGNDLGGAATGGCGGEASRLYGEADG